MRRRILQNSPEASTSTTPVLIAIDTISPPLTGCDALALVLRQWAKKYFALPLWIVSNRTPTTTASTIRTR